MMEKGKKSGSGPARTEAWLRRRPLNLNVHPLVTEGIKALVGSWGYDLSSFTETIYTKLLEENHWKKRQDEPIVILKLATGEKQRKL